MAPDATALGAAFASGRLEPPAVIESLLRRIEDLDPVIGACNHVAPPAVLLAAADAAGKRWRAGVPRSPLDGVPFGVKANIAVAGWPWHSGIAALRGRLATEDANCVVRLRAAGMVPLAVLNMHEAALGVTSDNPAFRTTRNPRALDCIPGGSSGGSAAAVACGMLPITLGTDDLGSVRLPSALCGVVGFKPGHGEVPVQGVEPLAPRLDHVGIHARSVQDVAQVFALLRGHTGDSATLAAEPRADGAPPLAQWLIGDPEHTGAETASAIRDALQGTVGAHRMNHPVDWTGVNLSALRRAGLLECERSAAKHFAALLRERPAGFSAEFRQMTAWGAAQGADKVREAADRLAQARRSLRAELRSQLLVGPTVPHRAPRRDAPTRSDLADFTAPAAIAGVPAISVPIGRFDGGPPIGMQIVGTRSQDVLRAATVLFPGVAPIAQLPNDGGEP
ncbi:MAG: amidase [Gammaproteobacteria bacterium]|nr:amidase [Gammaproteobacteria bacterium]MYK84679.1 amidase [Gammaproteobacteria bacterium]